MHRKMYFIRAGLLALAFAFFANVVGHAQGGQNVEGKKAEEVYKNIKILTGVPATEITPSMHLIEAETGETPR